MTSNDHSRSASETFTKTIDNSYTPVHYVYREVIQQEIAKRTQGKIFYFSNDQTVESFEGQIAKLKEIDSKGCL